MKPAGGREEALALTGALRPQTEPLEGLPCREEQGAEGSKGWGWTVIVPSCSALLLTPNLKNSVSVSGVK